MAREIPLLYGSPNDRALFEPKDFISHYYPKARGFEIMLAFFSHKLYNTVAKEFKARKTKAHDKRLHASKAKINGNEVGLICFQGIGAPNSAAFLEEFIELGTKKFIFAGSVGTLQGEISVGDLMLPAKAIRDEGTSYHYLKQGKYAYADKKLLKALEKALKTQKIKYFKGASWTTDAPYRETIRKLKKYRKEGVLSVEMEASALFAVAALRKIQAAGLFYASDVLGKNKWTPAFGSKEANKGRGKIARVLFETVKSLM